MHTENLITADFTTYLYRLGRWVIFLGTPCEPMESFAIIAYGEHDALILGNANGNERTIRRNDIPSARWRFDEETPDASAEDIIAFKDAVTDAKRAAEETAEKAKTALEKGIAALRANPEFSHLKPIAGSYASAAEVSANVRRHLKKHFPAVKFSVRSWHHNAVSVKWEDGPTRAKIESLLSEFNDYAGTRFDDLVETKTLNPFRIVFGCVTYLNVERTLSDALKTKAVEDLNAEHGTAGRTYAEWQDDFDDYRLLNEKLSEIEG